MGRSFGDVVIFLGGVLFVNNYFPSGVLSFLSGAASFTLIIVGVILVPFLISLKLPKLKLPQSENEKSADATNKHDAAAEQSCKDAIKEVEGLAALSLLESESVKHFKCNMVHLYKNNISCNELIPVNGLTWEEIFVLNQMKKKDKFLRQTTTADIKSEIHKYKDKYDIVAPDVPPYLRDNFNITINSVINQTAESIVEKQDWAVLAELLKGRPDSAKLLASIYHKLSAHKSLTQHEQIILQVFMDIKNTRMTFLFKDSHFYLAEIIRRYETALNSQNQIKTTP